MLRCFDGSMFRDVEMSGRWGFGASRVVFTLVFLMTFFTGLAMGSEVDTLDEVVVQGQRRVPPLTPSMTLSGEALKRLNSNTVADALRYFSGVQIKDYGGVGGVKTVNVRSMGTNHTGVVYDGIELSNAQNGQIDLGQYSLDNIEALSVYNGERSDLLMPARQFGSAATVYMTSRRPDLDDRNYRVRASVKGGSFGTFNPAISADIRLSQRFTLSASAEWLYATGKYKFRYRRLNQDNTVAYDTTATRHNGDINALRAEVDLNGSIGKNASWHTKVYHYNSERGIPGAVVNNVWFRGERLWDNNTFAQSNIKWRHGRYSAMLNAKYAFYQTHYINKDERVLPVDNLYRQQEVYVSASGQMYLTSWWKVAAAYDFQWNSMTADLYDFCNPWRASNYGAVSTAVNAGGFSARASALINYVYDRQRARDFATDRWAFTPAIYLSYTPQRFKNLTARAFFKQSYRMPTFNDLFYTDIGNASLSPERVSQYNIGLNYESRRHGYILSGLAFSADAYYNYVKDKIVAYPKGQQFRWTMLNLGKVDIRGIDVSASATLSPTRDMDLTLRATYTYQRAIDITDQSDPYYRDMIPYIPRHSGSAIANISWRDWGLNYSFIYVGERYSQQENIPVNYIGPWYTSDLSLSYDFSLWRIKWRAMLQVNNILDQAYDVIAGYPMPGINFKGGLTLEF